MKQLDQRQSFTSYSTKRCISYSIRFQYHR
uniref:Uncharacterized protein n=1 Tax=Arundo donax TaxID=35708 RepID=A0A0A9GH96_ARUDO